MNYTTKHQDYPNTSREYKSTLFEKCKRLDDYSYFIGRVRILSAQDYTRTDAINQAMDECINQNILKDILTQQRAEVLGVLLSTFNKELYEKGLKDNAYNEGFAEGTKKNIIRDNSKEACQRQVCRTKQRQLMLALILYL